MDPGLVYGQCQTYTLDAGDEYLIISIQEEEDKLVLQKALTSDDADAERLQKACSMNRQPPRGLTEVPENCPRAVSETECIAVPREIEQHRNACKMGEDTHDHGETWIDHEACVKRCRCSDGLIVCNKSCPPLGELPPPSEHCPEPHYAPHDCCPRLDCYKDSGNNEEDVTTVTDSKTSENPPPSPEMSTHKPNAVVKDGGDTEKEDATNNIIKPPETVEARGDASSTKIVTSQGMVAAILQMVVTSVTVWVHLYSI